jgi:hypothetical protein
MHIAVSSSTLFLPTFITAATSSCDLHYRCSLISHSLPHSPQLFPRRFVFVYRIHYRALSSSHIYFRSFTSLCRCMAHSSRHICHVHCRLIVFEFVTASPPHVVGADKLRRNSGEDPERINALVRNSPSTPYMWASYPIYHLLPPQSYQVTSPEILAQKLNALTTTQRHANQIQSQRCPPNRPATSNDSSCLRSTSLSFKVSNQTTNYRTW